MESKLEFTDLNKGLFKENLHTEYQNMQQAVIGHPIYEKTDIIDLKN
jgi:hypothetical protein